MINLLYLTVFVLCSSYKEKGKPKRPAVLLRLSFLIGKIGFDQCRHQLIPIDFANQRPGIFISCDVGGVFRQNITDDLIDRVIPFSAIASKTAVRICFISPSLSPGIKKGLVGSDCVVWFTVLFSFTRRTSRRHLL